MAAPEPTLPDYGGACLTGVVPALLARRAGVPPWVPSLVAGARQVVLLVLDGLGWEQLQERRTLAPTMASMAGGPITTVAPSTTATALTSLTTGVPPAVHGVVGYRIVVGGEVLNVLRWTTPSGDARDRVPPESIQPLEPFAGRKAAVVTRAEFSETGFSRAHLAGSELFGWRYPSTLVARVAQLLADGRELVYAYYAGVDTVAHEFGFGDLFDAEVAAADRLVAQVRAALPPGAALVVVADHGQVDVGERVVPLAPAVARITSMLSGEGRFRWLHAGPGLRRRLAEVATEHHGGLAWVRTRQQILDEGWLGGSVSPAVADRLGDVALVAHAPVAFADPADTGSFDLRCRHGSLTAAEICVPLLAAAG